MPWQFPPTMRFDGDRSEAFLALLPHDTKAATALAAQHDEGMKGRSSLGVEAQLKLRHAVEIRHVSFCNSESLQLRQEYRTALVCADTNKWPRLKDVTADFIYCRLHGPAELYAGGYDETALAFWRDNIACWAEGGEPAAAVRLGDPATPQKSGRDVFVFFDTDRKVRAPYDAASLMERLGMHRHFEEEEEKAKESTRNRRRLHVECTKPRRVNCKPPAGKPAKAQACGGYCAARDRRFQPGEAGHESRQSPQSHVAAASSHGALTRLRYRPKDWFTVVVPHWPLSAQRWKA